MTIIYTPIIVTRIPADIDPSKRAEIEAKLHAARNSLHNYNSYSRDAALELAAWAITRSGAGACAYADVSSAAPY